MKRLIRLGTFETNSSSMHTLVLMSPEDFELFKRKELFYSDSSSKQFITRKDIPNLEAFKEDYPHYKDYDNDSWMIDDFIDERFDTDYAEGYSFSWLECPNEEVYDKDGNKQIAVAIYIGG